MSMAERIPQFVKLPEAELVRQIEELIRKRGSRPSDSQTDVQLLQEAAKASRRDDADRKGAFQRSGSEWHVQRGSFPRWRACCFTSSIFTVSLANLHLAGMPAPTTSTVLPRWLRRLD